MQWKLKQFLKLGGGVCNQGELNRKQAGIATRDNGSQGLAFFKIPTTNGFAPVFRIRNGIGSFPHRTDGAVRGSLMELEWKACNSVWRETGGLVVSGARKEFLHIAARSGAIEATRMGSKFGRGGCWKHYYSALFFIKSCLVSGASEENACEFQLCGCLTGSFVGIVSTDKEVVIK